MFIAEVKIELKRGVADPEGENTKKALKLLGFDEIETVKSVKLFEIVLSTDDKEKAKEQIKEMCSKLLANPVIHNYSIKLK